MLPAADTPLARTLHADARTHNRSRAAQLVLFERARTCWLAGERVDVGRLAGEVGIGRATAFRWVGSRDELLGEVIWSFYQPTLQATLAGERRRGAERIAAVTADVMRAVLKFRPMRRWLEEDSEHALRIVTAEAGVVQTRTVAFVEAMIRTEIAEGHLAPLLDPVTLSLLVIRISSSFLYSDVTCGRDPSVESAYTAIRILAAAKPETD